MGTGPVGRRVYGRWDGPETVERLKAEFPGAILESADFRGETTVVAGLDAVADVMAFLRDAPETRFDMLTDVTAVHWPARPAPFEIVWHLYSLSRNVRLRVKASAGPEPKVPSVVPLWPGAGWLERECYDMFGVVFDGHPDLRRILMPEDFGEWPLRKDFPLKY